MSLQRIRVENPADPEEFVIVERWERRPRYRWYVSDYLLFSIPAAAFVLAGLGRLLGWAP